MAATSVSALAASAAHVGRAPIQLRKRLCAPGPREGFASVAISPVTAAAAAATATATASRAAAPAVVSLVHAQTPTGHLGPVQSFLSGLRAALLCKLDECKSA